MPIRESSFGYWSSNRAFLYVAAGAAIGIGNISRLPYLAGQNGGSLFLMAYLAALLVLAWPVLTLELVLGRWIRTDLMSGMQKLAESAGSRRHWEWLGLAAVATAVLVLSYYSVIAGWSLAYAFRAASGSLYNQNADALRQTFYALAQDPERSLAWHTIFMVSACVIVAHGALDGIERACRYLVPASCAMVIVLFAYAFKHGDAQAVMARLFVPAPSHFGWRAAMEAIHQAFFTMALGLGSMAIYGSYLPARAPVAALGLGVLLMDTAFGLVGGTALYALVLGAGLDPAPGILLTFQEMPLAVPHNAGGVLWSLAMYLVLFAITLTAAVALMEPVVRLMMDRYRLTRVFAATSAALVIWFIGLATLLSFNKLAAFKPLGGTIFDWLQSLTAMLLPALALLLCAFVNRSVSAQVGREAWGEQAGWLFHVWHFAVRYPVRILLLLLLSYVTGLLDWLVSLWA